MKKVITTIILTCIMAISAVFAPVKNVQAASPAKYHGCSHCQAMYGYAVPMKYMWSQDNLKCPTCGPIAGISYFECYTCSDNCNAVVCPNGHAWVAKG